MRRTYRVPEPDEATLALGRKVVDVLVSANVTYAKALDALEAAQDILEDETRPLKA